MRSQGNKEVKMESQHKAVLSRWAPLLWGLMLNSFVAVDGSGELYPLVPLRFCQQNWWQYLGD